MYGAKVLLVDLVKILKVSLNQEPKTFSESGLEYDATQKWLPVPA